MGYSIGEFSALTNLGIHTLRYYEKENLISPERQENGRRCYSENDVDWIRFIKRLKDTGMPIKDMQQYAAFRAIGDSTQVERMAMLRAHRAVLNEKIMQLQEHLEKLDSKIGYYQVEIAKKVK